MYTRDTVSTCEITPLAYSVGPNKDSYQLVTWFSYNLQTGETTVHAKAEKNGYFSSTKREELITGTPKECIDFVKNLIEGEEWIKDENGKEVYPKAIQTV